MGIGSFVGGLFSDASTAVSGFSVGTWIKIGLAVVVLAAFGGLYWYGQHEAGLVSERDKTIGQQSQLLADKDADIQTLQGDVSKWHTAFDDMQQQYFAQQTAKQQAEAEKDRLNEELQRALALLNSNPVGAADALNRNALGTVCLLVGASGGTLDGCAGLAADAPSAPAAGAH